MPSCLIVDHSKTVRNVEKHIMTALGYEIAEAENGQQALDHCTNAMPDLILLDWHMPVMDGLECVKKLRAMPEGNTPKVVFCTTESDPQHIMLALASGADEYVIKPFNADIIASKLQHIGL